jgi:asparagine synthase (glutamine-hydrolysing)
MSAITGIFYRDGRTVPEEQINKMNNRLSHRGPDGSAFWCEGSVALGHQMLYTTPESLHEILPFEEDSLVITADARIDNRKELSEKLGIEDKEEISDSYFILKAYQKWGEDCPKELLGDFAFAIWDKNKERLFCARDHMGVKPFYYYLDDEKFVFGTEIKAIFSVSEINCELNEEKIAFYLMKVSGDSEFTFYANIKCLNSASLFELDKDRIIDNKKYWNLNYQSQIIMDSEEEYIVKFREIFTEAIKCRLRSYSSIGFELSGGLDSSSIICMANRIFSKNDDVNAKTFSFISDIPEFDDQYYIQKIVENNEFKHNSINADEISPLEDVNTILWHHDQPFFSPHKAVISKMYKKIQDKNIHVLLTGQGGDDVISFGTYYLSELASTFQWKKLIKNLNGNPCRLNLFKIIYYQIIIPLIPAFFRNFLRPYLNNDVNILNESFTQRIGIDINKYIKDKYRKQNSKEYHYNLLVDDIHQEVLASIDKTIAPYSIEVRHPFFDKRLIEFCYAIPTEIKYKFGWNRYLLRIAMDGILPKEIQWRPEKSDLTPLYARNLLLFEQNTLKEIFNKNYETIGEYVNINELQKILKKYESGKNNDPFDLWIVTILFMWLEYYCNNKSNI